MIANTRAEVKIAGRLASPDLLDYLTGLAIVDSGILTFFGREGGLQRLQVCQPRDNQGRRVGLATYHCGLHNAVLIQQRRRPLERIAPSVSVAVEHMRKPASSSF